MDIRIGVQQTAREISLESNQSPEEVAALVSAAIASGGTLDLVDDKGRRVIVAAEKIAYVEIGSPSARKVGFGANA